jgi:hypothetical protein
MISTDPGGGRIVAAPDGRTTFAFPQSSTVPFGGAPGQPALPNLPLIDAPPTYSPDTYGNRANAFAYVQTSVMNSNGIAAVVEVNGVNGHWCVGDAYYTQASAGWTWSAPVRIFQGFTDFDGAALPYHASAQQLGVSIAGINSLNQVLGFAQYGPNSSQEGPFVYKINSQTLLQLGDLNGNYLNVQPVAIADNGALLLEGQSAAAGGGDHALLLTPDGLSPSPLTVAPEPSAWMVLASAAAAFAIGQYRHRRSNSTPAGRTGCANFNGTLRRHRFGRKENRQQQTCLPIAAVLQ